MQRLSGRSVPTPPAPPPARSEFDLDDLHRAFEHWVSRQKPTVKTRMETKATLERFISAQVAPASRSSRPSIPYQGA
jgi:hypothetical protein